MSTINDDSSGTPADDPTPSRTLDEILADPDHGDPPVAVTLAWSGHRTVVLGPVDDQQVRIAPNPDGSIAAVSATIPARPIVDPTDQLAVYRRTIARLAAEVDTRDGQLRDLTERHDALQRQVEQIREYAIDRHRDGDICRDGLTRFLSHFNLEPFASQTRVRYTIVGSYLVDREDPSAAAYYARRQLCVDFGAVDDFIDDSADTPRITADATLEKHQPR